MSHSHQIGVIIPVLNEEASIGLVLDSIPPQYLKNVVVVDNGSEDQTKNIIHKKNVKIISESRRGYGRAVLRGIEEHQNKDIIVFCDGDYSDYTEEMDLLIQPIIEDKADFVLGSRMKLAEAGALLPQSRWGNKLAVFLIKCMTGFSYSDLGPFRAIRKSTLDQLNMQDKNFGWTVEMQMKAIRKNLRILEIPVRYRKRVGVSKITGTLGGTVRAGCKIIYSIIKWK